jgi:hypothetical protein
MRMVEHMLFGCDECRLVECVGLDACVPLPTPHTPTAQGCRAGAQVQWLFPLSLSLIPWPLCMR